MTTMATGAAAGCGCCFLVVSSSSCCRRLSSSLRSPSLARRRNGVDVSLRMRLLVVASAADSTQPYPPAAAAVVVPDDGFSLAKVREDVTRFHYGDEQHLDEALKRIFQYGQGGGIPRSAPTLQMIQEEVTEDGNYSLVLVFEAKALQLSDFEQRQAKFISFFGPGITAIVGKSENDLY